MTQRTGNNCAKPPSRLTVNGKSVVCVIVVSRCARMKGAGAPIMAALPETHNWQRAPLLFMRYATH